MADSTDETTSISFPPGKRVGARWQVLEKLGEGGFGQIYKVEDLEKPGKFAALKAEAIIMPGGSSIKLEVEVFAEVSKSKSPHVPIFFHAKKHDKYVYMVMELLGANLKTLKKKYEDELLPAKDWSRIGIQCLHCIKIVHDRGFVHRDIKPANFVMGYQGDLQKARIVHILDFGLARAYAFFQKGRWESRKARVQIDFRGTHRYASPNMHRGEELGRRDDIYSLMFMLIELHAGLPWQGDKEKEDIEIKKLYMEENPKDLVINFPAELHGVLPHLRGLNYYSRPNYNLMYDGLMKIMKSAKASMNDKFGFESDEEYKKSSSATRACKCEDAAASMSSDPVLINAPPVCRTRKEDKKSKQKKGKRKKKKGDYSRTE